MSTSTMARHLGRRGGKRTLRKYGKEHFKKLAILAVEARRKKAEDAK